MVARWGPPWCSRAGGGTRSPPSRQPSPPFSLAPSAPPRSASGDGRGRRRAPAGPLCTAWMARAARCPAHPAATSADPPSPPCTAGCASPPPPPPPRRPRRRLRRAADGKAEQATNGGHDGKLWERLRRIRHGVRACAPMLPLPFLPSLPLLAFPGVRPPPPRWPSAHMAGQPSHRRLACHPHTRKIQAPRVPDPLGQCRAARRLVRSITGCILICVCVVCCCLRRVAQSNGAAGIKGEELATGGRTSRVFGGSGVSGGTVFRSCFRFCGSTSTRALQAARCAVPLVARNRSSPPVLSRLAVGGTLLHLEQWGRAPPRTNGPYTHPRARPRLRTRSSRACTAESRAMQPLAASRHTTRCWGWVAKKKYQKSNNQQINKNHTRSNGAGPSAPEGG